MHVITFLLCREYNWAGILSGWKCTFVQELPLMTLSPFQLWLSRSLFSWKAFCVKGHTFYVLMHKDTQERCVCELVLYLKKLSPNFSQKEPEISCFTCLQLNRFLLDSAFYTVLSVPKKPTSSSPAEIGKKKKSMLGAHWWGAWEDTQGELETAAPLGTCTVSQSVLVRLTWSRLSEPQVSLRMAEDTLVFLFVEKKFILYLALL